jgi:hypothetical protein
VLCRAGVAPFVISDLLLQLPVGIIFPAIYACIAYPMGGLRWDDSAVHFAVLLGTSFLLSLSASGLALLYCALTRSLAFLQTFTSASAALSAWSAGSFHPRHFSSSCVPH